MVTRLLLKVRILPHLQHEIDHQTVLFVDYLKNKLICKSVLRIVFMGTAEFAVPSLKMLVRRSRNN